MNTTKNKRDFFTVESVKRYLEKFDRDDEVSFVVVSSDKRVVYTDIHVFGITDSKAPIFIADINLNKTENFDEEEIKSNELYKHSGQDYERP